MSRYVVTGCAGFIGSHLTDKLLGEGHEVIGVDAFTDYYPRKLKDANLSVALDFLSFELVEFDLAGGVPAGLLEGVDGIFHLAAQPGVRGSWGQSFDVYTRDNLLATQRVFEAAASGGVRVIFASSSSVYGNAEAYPTSENALPHPISPYGVTKLGCEQLARAYVSFNLDVVSLRYFTVYGPRQRPDMAFSRLLGALVEGRPFHVLGNGEQSRDFTYVSDAVTAAVYALAQGRPAAVYNIGGGTEASIRAVINLIESAAARKLDVRFDDPAAGDVGRTSADTRRARRDLGWFPEMALDTGVLKQLEWMLEQGRMPATAVGS
jgi:UDP-glucuronate 4-epimerase